MKILACVLSYGKDQHLIPEFLRSWDQSSVDKTVVLSDGKDPVTLDHGLDQFPFVWKTGVKSHLIVDVLLRQALAHQAEAVLKLDCDVIHNKFEWFQEEADSIGFSHHKFPESFYGCAYKVKTSALITIHDSYEETPPIIVPEDICISRRIAELGLDLKVLERGRRLVGADNRIFENPEIFYKTPKYEVDMVHCGEFGNKRRSQAGKAMKALNDWKLK